MAQHTIPIVDLNDYISGDANSKSTFINALGKAYEEFGFVSVKNHGIPDAVVNEYYKSVESFFALPTDEKLKYEIKELAGQRGYTSFGREHAKGSTAPDLKEFWQMGQIVEDNDPIKSQYPDNVNVGFCCVTPLMLIKTLFALNGVALNTKVVPIPFAVNSSTFVKIAVLLELDATLTTEVIRPYWSTLITG